MKLFGHALYFSEDLLLISPDAYFLIDFKEISSTILAKEGGNCPPTPPWLRHCMIEIIITLKAICGIDL